MERTNSQQLSVNISEALNALAYMSDEQHPDGILIIMDTGVHAYCDIGSNCPEAIKFRRHIEEAGITLEEVIQEVERQRESLQEVSDPGSMYSFPEFSGKAEIVVAGQSVEIDMSQAIESELKRALGHKLHWFIDQEVHLKRLGGSLYNTYLQDI